MGTVTIDLDEFRIDENMGIYVYGEAELDYKETDDDFEFHVTNISICPYTPGTGAYEINKKILIEKPGSRDAMLFLLISDAVEEDREEIVRRAIEEDLEYKISVKDAWIQDAFDRIRDDEITGDVL
jgi:hypothetical protein